MKVLVIGSGGREHALVWKLRQSKRVRQVYCIPGNGGICAEAECVAADVSNLDSLLEAAHRIQPDLTVVGPEGPLSLGVVDEFQRRGLRIFGPRAAAARLESSKSFAKEFMYRHRIPTARYAICDSMDEVRENIEQFRAPVVVKADGLAAGKGVVIAKSRDEAMAVAADMLSGKMVGEAGGRVVLEEFLEGDELSFLVLSDGERVTPLVAAQDHKRVGDGDTGPNTGGMGAYSTPTLVDDAMRDWLVNHIARPVVAGMREEGSEFRGILYCGLIMTARGPMVLEFNARFGDPETQSILPRLEGDLLTALAAVAGGDLRGVELAATDDAAVTVTIAGGYYPAAGDRGTPIEGVAEAEAAGALVFHAGTALQDGRLVTNGGRILNVTGVGASVAEARARAYAGAERISFAGARYRSDIAEVGHA